MAKLSAKMERFCLEYCVDFNATQAAIRSGYSKKTAGSIGGENLKKPAIIARLAELTEEIAQNIKLDAEWIRSQTLAVVVDARASRDRAAALRGLDLLAKHVGFYEEDNRQRQSRALDGFADLPPDVRAFITGKIRDAIKQSGADAGHGVGVQATPAPSPRATH